MRSVTRDGNRFQVSDDPHGVLADFLALATCNTSSVREQILRHLEPGGDGYAVQDASGAFEIESVDDIPGGFFDDSFVPPEGPDWWIVWKQRQRPEYGSSYALLPGAELRHLLTTALQLREPVPAK